MLRLCSDSSRSYPRISAPHAFRKKSAVSGNPAVMEQKSAEALVDKDSSTHGSVVAGNKPGKNPGRLTLSKGRT